MAQVRAPLRVVPVLDLKGGRAVHAVGGDRAHYGPAASVLHGGADPVGLALGYRDVLGLSELYLADLDAIAGGRPSTSLYGDLADLGMAVWVDAGVGDAEDLAPLLGSGPSGWVLGLETLQGPGALARVVSLAGPDRLIFGLDLRVGLPLAAAGSDWGTGDPRELAEVAIADGLKRVLLLDLARVGRGRGVGTIDLASRLAGAHPGVEFWVGGGVAGPADLPRMARTGVAAVLVGSALRDGRIGRAELEGLTARGSTRGPTGSGR